MAMKHIEKVKIDIRNSKYVEFIRNNYRLMFGCMVLTTFFVLLTYPGIMYSDSYSRISMADDVKLWFHVLISDNSELSAGSSWLTLTPSYFICISKTLIGSVVLYTFLQCFFFFFILFITGKKLIDNRKGLMLFYILLTPVFSAFSIYYEASVGCVTGILGLVILIWKWDDLDNKFDRGLTIILVILSSFITFGYRANSLTILPVLILIIFIKERRTIKSRLLIFSVLLGFLLVSLIPNLLSVYTMPSYAAGFAWETVSTIQSMDEKTQAKYNTYLDDIFGEGATQEALEKNNFIDPESANINAILGDPFSPYVISQKDNTAKITMKLLELVQNEPIFYLKTKATFIANTMGIGSPINMWEYNYNRNNLMSLYNYNDSSQRVLFVDYFLSYMEFMKVFRTPWVLFIMATVLLIIWRKKYLTDKKSITSGFYVSSLKSPF